MRGLERAFKRGAIRLAAPLFPQRRAPSGAIRSILLVRVDDRLGNLVLLSGTIDWLRRARPETRVGLLMSGAFASIYDADPRLDERIILDKSAQKRFFPVFMNDLVRVGRSSYDAAIECSDRNSFSFSSALYARASRAPRRIGFANDLADRYLSEMIVPPPDGHAARDPLILAAALLGEDPPAIDACRPSVRLPEPAAEWSLCLDRFGSGAEDRIVGIHVGGRGAKRWPNGRFVELAERLIAAGMRPWIFRGPMEADADVEFAPLESRGAVTIPLRSIVEVGQAFLRCRLLIAPDTGPMHLASAVGTPTLGLFLSSDPQRYAPIGPDDRWLDARGTDLPAERVTDLAIRCFERPRAAVAP